MTRIAPLTSRDVTSVVGALDDARISAIIATGAGPEELMEAFVRIETEESAPARPLPPLVGRVAAVYDILASDLAWPDEP